MRFAWSTTLLTLPGQGLQASLHEEPVAKDNANLLQHAADEIVRHIHSYTRLHKVC
jgi:hypothetical protein